MTCIWKPEGSDFGIVIRSEPSRVTLCLAAALALMSPTNASAAPDIAHATRVTAMASAGPEARPRALFSGASLLQDEWVR
ncbi:MAG: hypothetical protein JWL62_501, partial [Hyphomicrobiales bacterium]|nr:hypothetical protein [Hyphomicrobiales bacterium]